MAELLTDTKLRRLKHAGGQHASADPSVIALLADIVNAYPRAKIHWLNESREAILNDWCAKRLLRSGRLAAMIDKASSVATLRRLAQHDLQQYANDQRRSELPTRLFRRLDQLLHNRPERFTIMLASRERGSTCWTLTERPATAVFSERDRELISQVLAVALTTLDETPDARKQSQFLSSTELERYAFEILERSARGFTLDQLVRGLVLAYGLQPTFEELPAEEELGTGASVSERHGIPTLDPPEAPVEAHSAIAARSMLEGLTKRQRGVLKRLLEEIDNQREIASALDCSPATISNELQTIRAAIEAAAPREEQAELLLAAANLLFGDGYEL